MEGVLLSLFLFFCFCFSLLRRKRNTWLIIPEVWEAKGLDSLIFLTNIYLNTDFVLGTLMSLGATALNSTEKMSLLWELGGKTNNEKIKKKIGNDSAMLKIRWRWRDEDGEGYYSRLGGQERTWRMWYFSQDLNDKKTQATWRSSGTGLQAEGTTYEGDQEEQCSWSMVCGRESMLWDVAQGSAGLEHLQVI